MMPPRVSAWGVSEQGFYVYVCLCGSARTHTDNYYCISV